MKTYFLFSFFLLIGFCSSLFSQEKENCMIRCNGWYWYTFQDKEDLRNYWRYVNDYAAITHTIRFSPVIARKMGNHFYGMLGINYQWAGTEKNPDRYVPEVDALPDSTAPSLLAYTHSSLTQIDILPHAGIEYFYGFRERVFFVLGLNSGIGFQRNTNDYTYYLPDFQSGRYKVQDSDSHLLWDYYCFASLRPSVRVSLSEKMGLELEIGQMVYRLKGFLSKESISNPDSHAFNLNFHPEYWNLGLYIII